MNLLKRDFLKNTIRIFSLFLLVVFVVVFTGCAKSELQEIIPSNYAEESHAYETFDEEKESVNKEEEKNKSEAIYDNQYQDSILTEEELLKYKANELGSVMILMYHQIGDTEAEWMRKPQNFRRDLLNLYENDYRLISLLDYINGNIDIDAGKSPVVITFDDATQVSSIILKPMKVLNLIQIAQLQSLRIFVVHIQTSVMLRHFIYIIPIHSDRSSI
jgi:hypothetical protein